MATATIATKTLFIVSTSSAGNGLRCSRHARRRVHHHLGGDGRSTAVQIAGDGAAAICLEGRRGRLPAGRLDELAASRELAPGVSGALGLGGRRRMPGHPGTVGTGGGGRRKGELRGGV